jgi:Spy/CpxP family protein refolding chaperone
MKIHKISLIAVLAAAIVLAYSPALRAQENKDAPKREGRPGGGDFVKQRMDRLTEELKLTDEQKPKVEALLKAQVEKMRGLRDATPEERREKMTANREEMAKKMKEILTAEQFEKYQKLPAPGRGPRGEKKKRDGEKK